MSEPSYKPIYLFCREETVESIHYGSLAVVNSQGKLLAYHGNPQTVTYMRSTAKPFQALPFIEHGGAEEFDLTEAEIALICASHSGTDEHIQVLKDLQKKIGITEANLMCGTHPPYHKPTRKKLQEKGVPPTSNRHNCSGKHTGMLGFAKLLGASTTTYLEPKHPVQQHILQTLSEMCSLGTEEIQVGTDGCTAPTFAIPLYHAAWGLAKLADPQSLSPGRKKACHAITEAMINHPFMVAGPSRLDTKLMDNTHANFFAKSGAEAYQGIGIAPQVIHNQSRGIGVALKISDGDRGKRAKSAVVLEILKQLDVLSEEELKALSEYGPEQPRINYRNIVVGHGKPTLELEL